MSSICSHCHPRVAGWLACVRDYQCNFIGCFIPPLPVTVPGRVQSVIAGEGWWSGWGGGGGCGRWGGRGRRRYGMTERCKRRTGRSSDRSLAAAAAAAAAAPLLRQRPARCRPFHRFPGRVWCSGSDNWCPEYYPPGTDVCVGGEEMGWSLITDSVRFRRWPPSIAKGPTWTILLG